MYAIGFRDAMSNTNWLYHSKMKDAVLDSVKDLYERVSKPRRSAHDLKLFVVQSDNGEFKSNAVLEFLRSVGGERLTCCVYSPESDSKIKCIWCAAQYDLSNVNREESAEMITQICPRLCGPHIQ